MEFPDNARSDTENVRWDPIYVIMGPAKAWKISLQADWSARKDWDVNSGPIIGEWYLG